MWDELTMDQKARWMAFFARNSVYNRDTMKDRYNSMYLSKMEKVAQDNYRNWGYQDQDQALVHALNDNTYDYNKWFADNPGSMENSDTHWTDRYKTAYHPTFSDQSMYSGVVDRNYNPKGKVGGRWQEDDFVPYGDQYGKGGSIHIKHPGRLTALKKRTGKTEAELWKTGSAATRKMITFARNARKWKHDDGGIIWDQNGQYNHPGYITGITGGKNGTDITMNGVADYLIGIDNLGNKKFMKPGMNYHFKGGKVVEYPIMYQFGGLLGNTKFTDYAGKARLQNMNAGLPFGQQPKYTAQNAIAPAIQSIQERHPENVQYLPQYAQDYLNMNTPKEVPAIAEYIDPFDDRNRQVYAESGGNPNAVSKAGARGLFQIMPDTLKWYQGKTKDYGDVNDPVYNERVRDWLIDYLYTTNIATADGIDDMERKRRVYAAYNGGRGTVSKAIRNYGDDWINHVPAETRNYARFIVDKQDSGGSRTNDAYTKWYDAGNQYIKRKQYGGIIKPFSYFDIPVVRFDEGGYAYI